MLEKSRRGVVRHPPVSHRVHGVHLAVHVVHVWVEVGRSEIDGLHHFRFQVLRAPIGLTEVFGLLNFGMCPFRESLLPFLFPLEHDSVIFVSFEDHSGSRWLQTQNLGCPFDRQSFMTHIFDDLQSDFVGDATVLGLLLEFGHAFVSKCLYSKSKCFRS